MGTAAINALNLQALQVAGGDAPKCQGPRAVAVTCDFSAAAIYTLDYSNQQRQGLLNHVEMVYIDNSGTDNPVSIQFQGTQQVITAKGRTQGYYPTLVQNPFKCTISSAVGAPGVSFVNIQFLNWSHRSGNWATQ